MYKKFKKEKFKTVLELLRSRAQVNPLKLKLV